MEVTFHRLTREGAKDIWREVFARHHYMSDKFISQIAFVGILEGQPVVFVSCIFCPSGTKKKDGTPVYPGGGFYTEHRTVVLPDYQGMGIGVRASEWLGDLVLENGFRYYSKTAHPAMGAYRDNSPKWKASTKNKQERKESYNSGKHGRSGLRGPVARFSHEYIGEAC